MNRSGPTGGGRRSIAIRDQPAGEDRCREAVQLHGSRSVDAKSAQHVVVLLYNEATACPASFRSKTDIRLPEVKKPATDHFSVGELGEIGTNANSISYTCAYVSAQEKIKREQVSSASVKFTVAATGLR
jgi:hypothetical protein